MRPQAIYGWVLVVRNEDQKGRETDGWHVNWHEIFYKKKDAIKFAKTNRWPLGYRAMRGTLTAG